MKSIVICTMLLTNYIGVIYSLFTIFSQLIVGGTYTCPQLYGREQCRLPILFGCFLIFEIMVNFVLFHYNTKLNKVTSLLPDAKRSPTLPMHKIQRNFPNQFYSNPNSVLTHSLTFNPPADDRNTVICNLTDNSDYTKYCSTCQMTVPQRCHHCPLCNYCVLKKDHHCFIVGGCVGFGNQRYFLVFLFWTFFGAIYGISYAARYMSIVNQPVLPFGWFDYVMPHELKSFIFFQTSSGYAFVILLVMVLGIIGALMALILFVVQWYYILNGLTIHESRRKIAIVDRLSIQQKMEHVFGPYWIINFIFPLPFKNKLEESFKKIIYDYYVKEL